MWNWFHKKRLCRVILSATSWFTFTGERAQKRKTVVWGWGGVRGKQKDGEERVGGGGVTDVEECNHSFHTN